MAEKKTTTRVAKRKPSVAKEKPSTPVKVEAKSPVHEAPAKKALPSLENLFKESWTLFKSTFFSYFKLILIFIAFFVVGIIINIAFTVPLMNATGGNADLLFESPTALQILLMVLVVVFILVLTLGLMGFSLLLPIMYLQILDSRQKLSLKELFNKSKGFIAPYIFLSLIVGIAVLGGVGLFIIPGVLISILFMFVLYVMVFENLRGTAALKRSYALVKNNFWEIVLRALVLELVIGVTSYILNAVGEQSGIVDFIAVIFSFVSEWFAAAYTYLLYKYVRDHKAVDSNVNISWIWIVATIGIILLIALTIWLVMSGIGAQLLSEYWYYIMSQRT